MITIYGSKMCPDCRDCKLNFDAYGIEYDFIDINESLESLRDFLILRDSSPVFDHCKEINDIGLPALVLNDGSVTIDWETIVRNLGFDVIPGETHAACSLDRKGC